ncbi:hypothetical protein LINPERPRIM_LOCUS21285, partial [Linum perenne]
PLFLYFSTTAATISSIVTPSPLPQPLSTTATTILCRYNPSLPPQPLLRHRNPSSSSVSPNICVSCLKKLKIWISGFE